MHSCSLEVQNCHFLYACADLRFKSESDTQKYLEMLAKHLYCKILISIKINLIIIIICVFLSYGEHIQQIEFKYGSYIDRGKSELQTVDYRNWRPYH